MTPPAEYAAPAQDARPTAGEPGVQARLLHFTIVQLVRNVWTIGVICFFLGVTWWRHSMSAAAMGWLLALAVAFPLRALWLRPARDLAVLAADLPRWRRRSAVGLVLTALIVAAGPALTFPDMPDAGRMYMTMVLCCWLAGAMAVFGPMPRHYAAYGVLIVGGIIAGWLRVDSAYTVDIVVMLAVYVFVLAGFAGSFSRLVAEGMGIRHANDVLVAELREARDEAREQSRAKTRFLAVASHDLRQPLHALMMLNGLLGRAGSPERAAEVSAQMSRSLRTLDRLFTSLLDFSRFDSVAIEPRLQWQNGAALLERALQPLQAAAHARGLSLRHEGGDFDIHTDPELLERILRNLVDNAVKFTHAGGVRVTAAPAADGACLLTVADTGVGIPAELRGEVFKEYFQAPEGRGAGGLGLGLAIVRRLSRSLGLEVSLGANPGGGTRFELQLPPGSIRPSQAADEAEPAGLSRPAPLAPMTVLCIDDNADALQATAQLLRSWGVRVLCAASADEALALARSPAAIDVVLSDHQLGEGVLGSELIYRLRECIGEVPAALITGDAGAMRAHHAGQIEFPVLAKPLAPGELRQLLEVFQELD